MRWLERFAKGTSMKIQFLHPAILVQDIGISKRFYVDVLGLRVIEEHQDFVLFEMHFSIHQAQALWKTVFGEEGPATRTACTCTSRPTIWRERTRA
jgi:catechol 2,3-dioxygenase-like lactoylglutathione lyase family enzyme